MQALELDSNNEKGLFRRGEAHLAVNDFELARADFQKVIQLYPSNKAAKVQLVTCQQKIREQHEKEKKMYANMFQRLADKDLKVSNITPKITGGGVVLDKERWFRYSACFLLWIIITERSGSLLWGSGMELKMPTVKIIKPSCLNRKTSSTNHCTESFYQF